MAGKGKGSFCSTSKHANTLMDGFDLLLADIIAEWYKGFDPNKVKYLKFFIDKWNLSDIEVFVDKELKN